MSDPFGANRAPRWLFAFLDVGRRPDGVKGLVEPETRIDVAGKFVRFRDDRLKRRADECIAVGLAARQGAGVAAKEWKVWGEFLAKGHRSEFSLET